MAEGEDLTPEQTEKLLQFQDLTGIEDMEQCQDILNRHNWDMEVAVQDRLNEEEGIEGFYHEPRRQEQAHTPPVNTQPIDQRVIAFSRPRPTGMFQWSYFLITFPFRFVYRTFLDLFFFAYRLIRPDPRRYVTDPQGDVRRFMEKFEETYGPLHPTFHTGTYSQALSDAKKDLQFLLVYLHGDDHQDTAEFCRNTLCNPEVTEFINTRMVMWACNTNSPEGYRVSQALRENTYPFLALIVLRQNRMTLVARLEGDTDPATLIAQLTQLMQANEASLIAIREERQERQLNQSLREEQDQAYLESLHADQEKERKKREVEAEVERQEQERRDQEMAELRKQEEIELRKEELRNQIPAEPDSDDPNSIRILLKLPNGTRLERRFNKTDSLKELYNYVFVHEAAPDDFQVVTNFPRKILPCQPTADVPVPPSFEEVGLGKSEMLFVHDNEA